MASPAGLGSGAPPPAVAMNGKKLPHIIANNSRSSIEPENAPDPKHLQNHGKKLYIMYMV